MFCCHLFRTLGVGIFLDPPTCFVVICSEPLGLGFFWILQHGRVTDSTGGEHHDQVCYSTLYISIL